VGKAKRAHLSLSERSGDLLQITAPVGRKKPTFDETMKAAVRPIGDPRDFRVLHRIEVNVIDVAFKVGVVANGVLPKATLPAVRSSRAPPRPSHPAPNVRDDREAPL
jgi:hypothetical protein